MLESLECQRQYGMIIARGRYRLVDDSAAVQVACFEALEPHAL